MARSHSSGEDDGDRISVVPVAAMVTAAPAVVMATAAAPAIMMSAPATMHLAVTASVPVTALDLDDRIVSRRRGAGRRYSQPRGSRYRHRKSRNDIAAPISRIRLIIVPPGAKMRPVTTISRHLFRSVRSRFLCGFHFSLIAKPTFFYCLFFPMIIVLQVCSREHSGAGNVQSWSDLAPDHPGHRVNRSPGCGKPPGFSAARSETSMKTMKVCTTNQAIYM